MLKTIIRYAMFHYQKADSADCINENIQNCSHIILQKRLLHGLVRMTDYVCTFKYFYFIR